MAFRLPRLPSTQPSHAQMQVWWQRLVEQIEAQEAAQDAAIAAIAAAQAAADAAQTTATAAQTAADAANTDIASLEAGNLVLQAVNINGVRYVDDGSGTLAQEP